jgi:Fe2+ transport system protein FeoA
MARPNKMQTLVDLAVGARAMVSRLGGGRELASRLSSLGLTAGAEVAVVQNYGRGPIIVAVRGARLALGRGEAARVFVEVIGG